MNKIDKCHVCVVKYVPRVIGKPLPGEVVCGRDIAYFEFASGHDVVIDDDNEPCFGPGKHSFLQVGNEIVAQVEEIRRNHFVVTAWTHIKDFNAAIEEIKRVKAEATKPKPAPALPVPVLQATTIVIPQVQAGDKVEDKPINQTGPDRRIKRPIFRPTPKTVPVQQAQSPDVEICLAAVAKLESLPPAETPVEVTVECSTAPRETTESVAKQ